MPGSNVAPGTSRLRQVASNGPMAGVSASGARYTSALSPSGRTDSPLSLSMTANGIRVVTPVAKSAPPSSATSGVTMLASFRSSSSCSVGAPAAAVSPAPSPVARASPGRRRGRSPRCRPARSPQGSAVAAGAAELGRTSRLGGIFVATAGTQGQGRGAERKEDQQPPRHGPDCSSGLEMPMSVGMEDHTQVHEHAVDPYLARAALDRLAVRAREALVWSGIAAAAGLTLVIAGQPRYGFPPLLGAVVGLLVALLARSDRHALVAGSCGSAPRTRSRRSRRSPAAS